MAWSFDGVAFEWFEQKLNGQSSQAEFNRVARLVERPLLDSGDADIANIGYEPWSIEGAIYVTAANAAAFKAKNGTQATLTDGLTSWTAVASITLNTLNVSTEGATGSARFVRPRA